MKLKTYLLLSAFVCAAVVTISPALRAQDATSAPSAPAPSAPSAPAPSAPSAPAPSAPAAPPAGEGHHRGGGNQLEMLAQKLELTADQQAKIKPIMLDRHTKMMALHDDTTLTPEDRKAKVKALMESSNDQIKALLTPDQVTKFVALQAEMKEHREKQQQQQQAPAAPSATP